MSGGLDGQLQLNVTQICKDTENCKCQHKLPGLTVTKQDQVPNAKDFIACTHESSTPFLLQQVLGSRDNQLPQAIQKATKVTVYYWKNKPENPLFLEVKLQSGGTEYYYKYDKDEDEAQGKPETWTQNKDERIPLQQRLDDRNCGVNKAIVYDLTNNYSGSPPAVEGDAKSTCKREKRTIAPASENPTPPIGGNYTVKEYNVSGQETRISRVEYGTNNTTGIEPPLAATSQIRVYYWNHGNTEKTIPLLIEFKPHGTGRSTWFANTSQKNTHWNNVKGDTARFYDQQGTQPKPALTTKLDEVNCTVNNVTVIDIGKKPNPPGNTYCHDPDSSVGEQEHPKLIQVTDASKNPTYKDKIGRFVVYSHVVNPDVSKPHLGNKFHISEFLKDTKPIQLNGEPQLPLLNVTKFLVFWCGSGPNAQPLLFYLEYNDNKKQMEWYKKPPEESSEWIKLELGKKPPSASDTDAIWDILNSYDTECKFKWWHIITGTAGGGATGGVGYWAYKGFEWFFMAPWPRLM